VPSHSDAARHRQGELRFRRWTPHCETLGFVRLCSKGVLMTKKAVTLLTKIESLLSDVLDEYSVIEKQVEKNVRSVLQSAQASVASALKYVGAMQASGVRTAGRARKGGRRTPHPKRKSARSARAKKRVAGRAVKRR